MHEFERHTLLGDYRHWQAGDEVLLRPAVAEKLHEAGLIERDGQVVSDHNLKPTSRKPARKQTKDAT